MVNMLDSCSGHLSDFIAHQSVEIMALNSNSLELMALNMPLNAVLDMLSQIALRISKTMLCSGM